MGNKKKSRFSRVKGRKHYPSSHCTVVFIDENGNVVSEREIDRSELKRLLPSNVSNLRKLNRRGGFDKIHTLPEKSQVKGRHSICLLAISNHKTDEGDGYIEITPSLTKKE